MGISRIIILAVLILSGCNNSATEDKQTENAFNETKESSLDAQFKNKTILTLRDKLDEKYQLDSVMLKWTDSYVPFVNDGDRLYSASLYSIQPKVNDFQVVAIRTNADHWNRIHLLTINEDSHIADKVIIADDWGELLEAAGDTEIVGSTNMYTKTISPTEYLRTKIYTTEIIDYYSDSTTYEIDSITSRIEIKDGGHFELTHLDSIRTIKYSGIE
ncbi:hypothetical protein [Marivirga harenae]|uniref:hypothetical protein n=1 Tax=Marivirga harenae TaxID=2010992 RepID=UPI0026DFE3C3|nr:hypothetical protein [Marivirga harenae]WKV12133.1 hypothetical protein Q3Y49_18205 [Marivirga harenae]|tara:strand:- start:243893 stop:244540 length:648 start_codon:yes stop_codon:yes gene_type:complete